MYDSHTMAFLANILFFHHFGKLAVFDIHIKAKTHIFFMHFFYICIMAVSLNFFFFFLLWDDRPTTFYKGYNLGHFAHLFSSRT